MSDSGDEKNCEQPSRKKRRAAQAAEAKFQEIGRIYFRGSSTTGQTSTTNVGEELVETQLKKTPVDNGDEDLSDEHIDSEEEGDYGVMDSDEEEHGQVEEESEGEGEGEGNENENENGDTQPGKSIKSANRKEKSAATPREHVVEYEEFSAPPFLQKILSKRQKEMDAIRRQLPVDSRNNEEKLADWYKMLSKLDKPVALLSMITPSQPAQQQD